MSGPHSAHREVDPVTGYDTTGHDWNGIKELNTPFPKIVIWALVLTFLYSVIAWVLLPTWPLGRDYTRGLLGLDQAQMAVEGARAMEDRRQAWLGRFIRPDFTALAADRTLMAGAMPAAARLFEDNCAACHGAKGGGGPGFPVLSDGTWLWGGDAETIAETIRVGINGQNPDTRLAQMPAHDWLTPTERDALADLVTALPEGKTDPASEGGTLFADNCATCHGDKGAGGLANGAPSLADRAVIYGQDRTSVIETLRHGRQGVMPSWSGRLSRAEINLLALYVARLGQAGQGAGQ